MGQSAYIEVSRAALRRNATAIREAVQVPVIGIVKCNGYGVTVYEAAAAWQAAGVTVFGVSRPEEAVLLRQAGFREDILLLCPVADTHTLGEMLDNDVILTVSGFENARFYSMHASQTPIRAHVAVDIGMGRFGVRWNDMEQAMAVYALPGFSFEGIYSHFSCAFEQDYCRTKLQLSRFMHMTAALQRQGVPLGIRHIANSCAALRFPETRLDAVRVGSALVGRLPVTTPVNLEKIGAFKAQVVDSKYFLPGDTTGYGSYCKIKKSKNAVIVALGREDGFGCATKPDKLRLRDLAAYLRHLLQEWRHPPYVVCNGQKMPVLGRIGMQYTLFDATGLAVEPGNTVEWNGNLMLSHCQRQFL